MLGPPKTQCPGCHKFFLSIAKHAGRSPDCAAVLWSEEKTASSSVKECDKLSHLFSTQSNKLETSEHLARLRYDRHLNNPDIEAAKDLARCAVDQRTEILLNLLLPPGRSRQEVLKGMPAAFQGLETVDQERAVHAREFPYIKPRVVQLGDAKEKMVSLPVDQLLVRLLQEDKTIREAVGAKSDEWKRGDKWQVASMQFGDVDDGQIMRFHDHLMRPATREEADDIRIGLIKYFDEVEARPHARALTDPLNRAWKHADCRPAVLCAGSA